MDKLTNHITVQSTRDFEKGTRNGKMLHSFSGPVLGFCLPSSLQWMWRAQLKVLTSAISYVCTTWCAMKYILNNWWNGVCWEHGPWRHGENKWCSQQDSTISWNTVEMTSRVISVLEKENLNSRVVVNTSNQQHHGIQVPPNSGIPPLMELWV